MQPLVSVVICTYGKNFTKVLNAVNSVAGQTYRHHEIIVVVENGDAYQEYKKLLQEEVRLLMVKKPGLSHARNAGVQNASGEIVAFIDDDAAADKDWLKKMVDVYSDVNVVCVGGPVMPVWEGRKPRWFPEELLWAVGCTHSGFPDERSEVRNVFGCNMSFRKRVFDEVGVFREELGRVKKKLLAGEEAEIGMRIMLKIPGAKIIYDPSVKVHHSIPQERQRIKHVLKRSFYEGVSKAAIKKMLNGGLSLEYGYLKSLLIGDVPRKVKSGAFSQAIIILLSIFLVGAGYLYGKVFSD